MNGTVRTMLVAAASAAAVAAFGSCSSLGRRPMKITEVSDQAYAKYETANAELLAGKMDRSLSLLDQSYKMAWSVDDADLLCRVTLSGVAFKVASGSLDAAAKPTGCFPDDFSAEDLVRDARRFADRTNRPDELLAVCAVYDVRVELSRGKTNARSYEASLLAAADRLEDEPFHLAHLYRTLGDVRVLTKDYSGADAAYVRAAELHTDNRYVGEIGTDWYGSARARSLSGDRDGALSSIDLALQFDRDAENSTAIASDYFARAKILAKGNPSADDRRRAREDALWAASVYRSCGYGADAAACEEFAGNLK